MFVNRVDFRKTCTDLCPNMPRTYEKNALNLLKSSIQDISTSTTTMFSIETLEKLCQSMLIKTGLRIFPFSKNR